MTTNSDNDDRRFERLVDRCLDEVYRTATRLCGRSDDAEELAHDTFVKARRAIGRLPSDALDRAWLFRILRNAWIDRARQKGREPELIAMTEVEGHSVMEQSDSLPPLFDVTTLEERRALEQRFDDHVLEALDELPEELRLALYFQVFGGLDYREIATVLDCPEGTVMSRLHRAKSRLRQSLAAFAEQNGITGAEAGASGGKSKRKEQGHG